jgi:D-glycero-alpha-D-manno-heptose-7-phosphate kinase
MEHVRAVSEIQHPIVREALRLFEFEAPHLEITSMADIPAGTGLGSSGSFTTALLRALHTLQKNYIARQELAEQACHIEIDLLGEPVGKQDQYIASFGGITCFHFHPDESVQVCPLRIEPATLNTLEDNLALFFTGVTRSASDILRDQDRRSMAKDGEMLDNLHFIKTLGRETKDALERGDLRRFAAIMHEHWERKRVRSAGMSNEGIDAVYDLARRNGALGGKLIGAGGGGFLMFYTEDKTRLRSVLCGAGLRELRFRFDFGGTSVVTQS